MKRFALLGSTGSIGVQTLELCRLWQVRPVALAAHRNVALLEAQAREFQPKLVAVANPQAAAELRIRLADTPIAVTDDITQAAQVECDIVLNAIVGVAGLPATLAALDAKRDIALANKESLVVAGSFIMEAANRAGVRIIPVDSEHSAISQCLQGNDFKDVKSITLTASGGPFYQRTRAQLASVTAADALAHPTWLMGPKITIDCATMMNKGLELIEAMHLFGLPPEQIEVTIHRQSIVHSMVNFRDGATLMQAGVPDMRVPIAYALTYPNRVPTATQTIDWTTQQPLTFAPPDTETFGCLALARQAAQNGQAACVVLNAANECAVEAFLAGKAKFLDIENIVAAQLQQHRATVGNAADCLALDAEVRRSITNK